MNTNMKFPDQHFITFREYGPVDDKYMMGFLIPDGTDAAARKRKETGINWGSKDIPHQTLKNEPQDGFKIMTKVSRGGSWNGQQDKWRVHDPRGFVLEIPAGNLEQILALTTIVEGVIQGKCLWGREGAVNMLVPVGSELYTEAMTATKIANSGTIPIKSINPGDHVTLQSGDKGIYMGHLYCVDHTYSPKTYYMEDKKLHIIKVDNPSYKPMFVGRASLKVVAVKPNHEPMTAQEAVAQINNSILSKGYSGGVSTFKSGQYISGVTQDRSFDIGYDQVDVTADYTVPQEKFIFMESGISGIIYRGKKGYYSGPTAREVIGAKQRYDLVEVKNIREPEGDGNRGPGYTSVSDADLANGRFFIVRKLLTVSEGTFEGVL